MAPAPGSENDAPIVVVTESNYEEEWSPDLDAEDLRELYEAEHNPSKIISSVPRDSNLLGYYSTLCLIFNRMIGSGIFNSPSIVFSNTQSIGMSIVLWVLGAVCALAGVFVYMELGLSIPRWPIDGEKIATPRSGEALNYFNYMLRRPAFLATCLFGITYIVLESTAPNAVSFAQNVLDASHQAHSPEKIIAIAISASSFACLLHAISRKYGIILNNILGTFKFFMLIFVVIIGLVWHQRDVAGDNFDINTSFSMYRSPKLPHQYAEAFTYVLYPYTGFHQINYIISELKEPRKTFPRAQFWGVLTVAILNTSVVMIYVAVIPKNELFTKGGIDVGARFFQLTLGRVCTTTQTQSIFSALKAISAIGNIIVVTFTAARVKQEIAKEGILPYSLLFAQSSEFSLSRFFWSKSPKGEVHAIDPEKTPVATLALHWALTCLMIVIPVLVIQPLPYSATPVQSFLTQWFVYDIDILIFFFIALGLLCLRLYPPIHWASKSEFKHPIISITASSILLTSCIFPLIFLWYPDPAFPFLDSSQKKLPWFAGQTAGLALIAFAFFYWVAFRTYISVRAARNGETLHIKREPKFKQDPSGGLTQVLEIVTLEWRKEVGIRLDEIGEMEEDRGKISSVSGASPMPEHTTMRSRNYDYSRGTNGGRGVRGDALSSVFGSEQTYEFGSEPTSARTRQDLHELDGRGHGYNEQRIDRIYYNN